ncbi:MAG: DUF4301 family protein [Marinilabiliaceae bacterium]
MIKDRDQEQLQEKGIAPETAEEQIERFKKGFPPLKVERPATLTDGIVPFSEERLEEYKNLYEQEIDKGLRPMKFVPASGAASRMFKALFQYLENPVDMSGLEEDHPVVRFIDQLPRFAFFEKLKSLMSGTDLDNGAVRRKHAAEIIHHVIDEKGLNYGFLPKGLILFHKYPEGPRTPLLEHLAEGAWYARDREKKARVHFTVSPEHLEHFRDELNKGKREMEVHTGTSFDVSFSFQKPHTDTIAVLPDNEPYRDENGRLLFRPGGHGALIENLNDCDAGIIFIKNIDNVVPEDRMELICDYKQALGGLALEIRNKVFGFIEQLEKGPDIALIDEIRAFLKETLHTDIPEYLIDAEPGEQCAYLLTYLNRPIRVCGMVKNEGEPGGGPFHVKDSKGQKTLQIVESSQLDLSDPEQKKALETSTHFNPVDLVCITKNHKGEKFDLMKYIDPETGFISEKSVNGKTIKALERPGLWNGAMANWLTIFVEVPVETFNPVKTINDLLRPAHQAG